MALTTMMHRSITGWDDHIADGRKILQTAGNGLSRPSVFNNALIFQLAAMAIEKLMVGVTLYHRQPPADHTLSGLVDALNAVCPMEADLAGRIRRIEAIDDICALSAAPRHPPKDEDVREILAVGSEVANFIDRRIPTPQDG